MSPWLTLCDSPPNIINKIKTIKMTDPDVLEDLLGVWFTPFS